MPKPGVHVVTCNFSGLLWLRLLAQRSRNVSLNLADGGKRPVGMAPVVYDLLEQHFTPDVLVDLAPYIELLTSEGAAQDAEQGVE